MIASAADSDRATRSALPSVSIVVPTHSRPSMLSRLLESFRQLAYPKSLLELVVVGGARDAGRGLVHAFAGSVDFAVTYHLVPANALGSASLKRNEGARRARGEILAFTDDDCMVHSDWIAAAVPLFEASQVGGVEGAVEIPRPDRPTLTYRGSRRLSLAGGYQTCSMFFRKSVFLESGGFDPSFPYYLEDTDLAHTVIERGYRIPSAPDAVVFHPVQPGRPLKLLTMARTVERMPFLFAKHAGASAALRKAIKPFNRSHQVYLALYGAAALVGLADPPGGAALLALGLCIVLPAHLAHDFWGLHFTLKELALTAVCQPLVPVLRVYFWLKGVWGVRVAEKARSLW